MGRPRVTATDGTDGAAPASTRSEADGTATAMPAPAEGSDDGVVIGTAEGAAVATGVDDAAIRSFTSVGPRFDR